MGKKIDGIDLVEMRYQIQVLLNFKPFEFEQKTNIRDINSSSSDDEEEVAEAVIWRCLQLVL